MVGHDHTDMKFVSPGEKGKKSYSFTTASIFFQDPFQNIHQISGSLPAFKPSYLWLRFVQHFVAFSSTHFYASECSVLPLKNIAGFNPGPGCRDSSLSREAQTSLFCPDTSSSSTGGELEVFLGQLRDIIPPAVLWSSSGPL